MADYEQMNIQEVQRLAKQGDRDALYEMAWRMEIMPFPDQGDGIENCAWQDFWWEKAADAGNIDAKSRYARSLINRVFDADDRNKAMEYFISLVTDFNAGKFDGDEEKELDGVVAILWLGVMLCQGLGTLRDADKGAALIKAADEQTKGFADFGFGVLRTLAEVYGQGCAQAGGEPSVDDLRQAAAYQRKAISRFNPERDDPNNRGYRVLAEEYLEHLEKRKEIKESLKDSASALGIEASVTNPDFIAWQNGMMEISPAAKQRKSAEKAALARLRQRLAQDGW